MLVYRVERRGKGPYKNGACERIGLNGVNTDRQPTPDSDGISFRYGRHKCGFESLEQLNAWFDAREKAKLHKHGYYVSVLKCPDSRVLLGRKQIMFVRRAAKILVKMPIKATSHVDIPR